MIECLSTLDVALQEFLMEDSECASADVQLRILLPDSSCLLLPVKRNSTASAIYSAR